MERPPRDRPQNVPFDVTPAAVEDFAYYRFAQTTGLRTRYLSVWGWPWWYADVESAPFSGGFSTAFNAAFDGGIAAAAFSSAFSDAFENGVVSATTAPAFSRAYSAAFS